MAMFGTKKTSQSQTNQRSEEFQEEPPMENLPPTPKSTQTEPAISKQEFLRKLEGIQQQQEELQQQQIEMEARMNGLEVMNDPKKMNGYLVQKMEILSKSMEVMESGMEVLDKKLDDVLSELKRLVVEEVVE